MHPAWALRDEKESFQAQAGWAGTKAALVQLEVMPMLADLVLGLPRGEASARYCAPRPVFSDERRRVAASSRGPVRGCVRAAAARVLGAVVEADDAVYPVVLSALLGDTCEFRCSGSCGHARVAGTGICETDDAVRRAAAGALLMSVVAGDLALLARLQDLFLAPNVSGEGSATKGVRRKVQIQVGEILRHVANENDGDLLSTLLDSVAADPVDHGRNEVLVRLLRP